MVARLTWLISLFTLVLAYGASGEQNIPHPMGKVVLTVSGSIQSNNSDHGAAFDRAMIERLGVRILRTSTNWTDGVKTFEGVSMRDLMTFVGARGSSVIASALNDSAVEIPISDFEQYDVLLAFRMDGRDLRVRDKGPLWIVYPRDQEEALRNPQYDSRWIGQLKILTVQ